LFIKRQILTKCSWVYLALTWLLEFKK
jgi:hypothetical protein